MWDEPTRFKLLGIHTGQYDERWEIYNQPRNSESMRRRSIIEGDRAYVKGVSGMTCALPASRILEVLGEPQLRDLRNRNEAQVTRMDIDVQKSEK
jgi:hypothetical protein